MHLTRAVSDNPGVVSVYKGMEGFKVSGTLGEIFFLSISTTRTGIAGLRVWARRSHP